MKNILLVIVDCLRYDYALKMPFLRQWGHDNAWYENHWSVSHCTDPSITCMLSGKHPDALKLYSMLFEHKDYTIPATVEMLPQRAQKKGFDTGFITNIGRWYKRGVNRFVDCRRWDGDRIFSKAKDMAQTMKPPWFLIVHTDDCHREYTGGSYDAACLSVDVNLRDLLEVVDQEETAIIITSDHGEGLGDKGIQQHGFGLWDFLTHMPLVSNIDWRNDYLTDNQVIYAMMRSVVDGPKYKPLAMLGKVCVYQAGDTPPNIRHRGVVNLSDGVICQFIRETKGDKITNRFNVGDAGQPRFSALEDELSLHCHKHGIDYWGEAIDPEVEERLKGLGYFDQ